LRYEKGDLQIKVLTLKIMSLSLQRINQTTKTMKYSELERKIRESTNCRFFRNGKRHPIWKNSDTGELFELSYHRSEEVKPGTLKSIIKKSGVKL